MRISLAIAIVLLAVPALADSTSDTTLSIEIGRFGVMLDHAAAAEKLLAPKAQAETAASLEGGTLFERLARTVRRFNVLSAHLCAEITLPQADCQGPFLPAWLSAPEGDRDDPERLRAMVDEAAQHIGDFWSDVCALAKAKGAGPHFCDIE